MSMPDLTGGEADFVVKSNPESDVTHSHMCPHNHVHPSNLLSSQVLGGVCKISSSLSSVLAPKHVFRQSGQHFLQWCRGQGHQLLNPHICALCRLVTMCWFCKCPFVFFWSCPSCPTSVSDQDLPSFVSQQEVAHVCVLSPDDLLI